MLGKQGAVGLTWTFGWRRSGFDVGSVALILFLKDVTVARDAAVALHTRGAAGSGASYSPICFAISLLTNKSAFQMFRLFYGVSRRDNRSKEADFKPNTPESSLTRSN